VSIYIISFVLALNIAQASGLDVPPNLTKKFDFMFLYKLISGKGSSPILEILGGVNLCLSENSFGKIVSLPFMVFIQKLLPLYSSIKRSFNGILSCSLTTTNTFLTTCCADGPIVFQR